MFYKKRRLTDESAPFLKEAWRLYEDSFPEEERRIFQDQLFIMKNSQYHFEVYLNHADEFMGFLLWWEFEHLCYVEHFATLPSIRGGGIGAKLMRDFISTHEKFVLLEVEIPSLGMDEADISLRNRRIKFYECLGFTLSHIPYIQPAYQLAGEPVNLHLMATREMLTTQQVSYFIMECQPVIFSHLH